MPKGIRLHKEFGVNPHLTACQHCGTELSEIVLLGDSNSLWFCADCNLSFIGKKKVHKCPNCKGQNIEYLRELVQTEVVSLGTCEQCKKQLEQAQKLVEEGGVYWRCSNCGSSGVLSKDNPFAPLVREKLQVQPPKPCGVEVKTCPACIPREEKCD